MSQKLSWLKRVLADDKLSQGAKNVATVLFMHHNQTTGQCNPSQSRIGEALGLKVRAANDAVARLKRRGWIASTPSENYGASDYVLMIDHLAGQGAQELNESADEAKAAGAIEGVRADARRGCAPTCVGDTRNGAQGVRATVRTELQREPPKEAIHLNPAPAEAVRTPEIEGSAGPSGEPKPASIQTAPTAQGTKPPEPANDDVRRGFVEIAGLKIPEGTHAQWVAAFTDMNLMAGILKRARWALRLPEDRRMNALQTELGKMNDEARQAQLDRRAHAEAKAAAPPPKPPRSRYAI